MTPKEKAIELVEKYKQVAYSDLLTQPQIDENAKQCALVAVDEIINELNSLGYSTEVSEKICKWIEVKQEIEKL